MGLWVPFNHSIRVMVYVCRGDERSHACDLGEMAKGNEDIQGVIISRLRGKQGLCASECGASAVEFALSLSVFLVILMGLFDLGRMMIVQNALDTAAREAARFGSTGGGGVDRATSLQGVIQQTLTTYGLGLVDPAKVVTTVSSYQSLVGVEQPEPFIDANGDGQYTPPGPSGSGESFTDMNGNGRWDADQGSVGHHGSGGQAVQYVMSYNWPSLMSLFSPSGVVTLTARAAVTNENF